MGVHEFLAMGGYALYVWTAWGVAVAVLATLFLTSLARARALSRRLDAMTGQGRHRRATAADTNPATPPTDSAEVAS
jgi:heme exporter protein D